jgi:cytochrome c oxidase subunit 2
VGPFPELRRLLLAFGLATLASIAVSAPALAGTGISPFPPEGVSPNGQHIRELYNWISIPALIIFLGVEAALLYAIIRYRKGAVGPDYQPPQWHGNTMLEVVWTAIPFVLVLAIAAVSFVVLQNDFTKRTDADTQMNVTVTAHQFGWNYDYAEDGIKVISEGIDATPMVVPTHKVVRLRLEATDVIHSFWVPDVTGKTDAVPGYSNYTWMKIDRVGEWRGECAELCGAGHYSMQIRIQAMDQADYDAWVAKQKQPKPSPSPTASPKPSPSVSPSSPASPPKTGGTPTATASRTP